VDARDARPEAGARWQVAAGPRRYLEYDPVESRLFRTDGGVREEVALSPQLDRLVQHAAERNRAAGDRPVLCTHDELIAVLWGPRNGTPQALAIVIHELRERVGPAHAGLVENVRGRGYRLAMRFLDGADPALAGTTPARRRMVRSVASPLLHVGAPLMVGIAVALGLAWFDASSRLPPPTPILRLDAHGDDVQRLQLVLADVGFDPGPADGQFGPMTARALREFQLGHGLVVDGEYGPNSRTALARELARRRAAPLVLGMLALAAAAVVALAVAHRRRSYR
jgi:DNA-binding winged helix-turn-helix (wHTH) protein